jgi:hypothetical protein
MAVEAPRKIATLLNNPKICWEEERSDPRVGGWEVWGLGDPDLGSPVRTGTYVSEDIRESGEPTSLERVGDETYIFSAKTIAGEKWRVRFRQIPCAEQANQTPAAGFAVMIDGGVDWNNSTSKLGAAESGSQYGVPVPVLPDPISPQTASAKATGLSGGAQLSVNGDTLLSIITGTATPNAPGGLGLGRLGGLHYAPEDKPGSAFPTVLPTQAPSTPLSLPPRISFNVEAGIYGFAGGKSTINGIPGGPGITPTGADSFNFRDNFMVTAGGAIVMPVTASLTAAVIGGFAGVDKTVTFNCVTYCVNGVPVPTFSDSKDVFLPGAYVGGRLQWPIAIPGLPGAAAILQYRHVFAFGENMSLGGVAQGRIVSINVAQDLDLVTAGVSIPLH